MELTKEEKEAISYLDWDNERLGQYTKECAKYLNSKRIDGYEAVTVMASIMLLIGNVRSANAGTFTVELKNVSSEMFPEPKNFKVTVEEI